MISFLPPSFISLFSSFAHVFTTPSFFNFVCLTTGWILCSGRHTISKALQAIGPVHAQKHHSVFYRLFSRARWNPDRIGEVLFQLVLPFIPGVNIYLLVDDTLCRKSGPHLWGGGMHHDPLASTYGRGTSRKRHVALAFGHNWVVLALWVPCPWNAKRGVAVPILFRFYPSKKYAPAESYRKRTELALELIQITASWIRSDRKGIVVGDAEYACRTILRNLPSPLHFIGPMNMKAALYDRPAPSEKRRGAPRKRGVRLPNPSLMATDPTFPWQETTLSIYGKDVSAQIQTRVCLWYTVTGTRPIQGVLTRDPKGRIEDRAYFSTDLEATSEHLLAGFARRWTLEVTFFNIKQFLGLENPQNGWGRGPTGPRREKLKPGPQPRGQRGAKAVQRTVPFVFVTYALIHLWYLQHGNVTADVQAVKARSPWYRHKTEPSFYDMLRAVRKAICIPLFLQDPPAERVQQKIESVLEFLYEMPSAA